eukprot:374287_1
MTTLIILLFIISAIGNTHAKNVLNISFVVCNAPVIQSTYLKYEKELTDIFIDQSGDINVYVETYCETLFTSIVFETAEKAKIASKIACDNVKQKIENVQNCRVQLFIEENSVSITKEDNTINALSSHIVAIVLIVLVFMLCIILTCTIAYCLYSTKQAKKQRELEDNKLSNIHRSPVITSCNTNIKPALNISNVSIKTNVITKGIINSKKYEVSHTVPIIYSDYKKENANVYAYNNYNIDKNSYGLIYTCNHEVETQLEKQYESEKEMIDD